MKLSAWARGIGISYDTAYRLYRRKKLPFPAEQLASGTIIVHCEFDPNELREIKKMLADVLHLLKGGSNGTQ